MDMSAIIGAVISPALSGSIVWYLLRAHFSQQATLLKEISGAVGDMKVKMAVHEERSALIGDMKKEIAALRDELTKTTGKVDAAWKVLDRSRE